MKKITVLVLFALGLMLVGCGSGNNSSSNSANINGNWTATLIDTNNATFFSFGTSLVVNGDGTLSVTNLTITSPSPCIVSGQTESGSFALSGNFNGQVSGSFNYKITSGEPVGNTLVLNGTVTGGTISGTWTLTGGTGCSGNGTFTMVKA